MEDGTVTNLPPETQCSRRNAFEHGRIIDVTDAAQTVGLTYPTAVTPAVWNRYVEPPTGMSWSKQKERLWGILWSLRISATGDPDPPRGTLFFPVPGYAAVLEAVSTPGDTTSYVITVKIAHEQLPFESP